MCRRATLNNIHSRIACLCSQAGNRNTAHGSLQIWV